MSIKEISVQELRQMKGQEGLVLQGCGGDPQEWLDGMNSLLTEAGILKNGSKFEDAFVFEQNGHTCILFPFKEDLEVNMGKFAIWRIQSHDSFGGTWLSDYVSNQLGGFLPTQQQKPDCLLIGTDGNIFALMGRASQTLRENGMADQAREMRDKITQCQSYHSALAIIGDYVNITSVDEMEQGMEMAELC